MLSRLFSRPKSEPNPAPVMEERDSIIAAIDLAPYSFTEAAAVSPPERLIGILNTYLETVLSLISASGGRCLRHIGCAVIAEWPLPGSEESGRTIGAGLIQIVQEARAIELAPLRPFRTIIGVAHGRVIHSTHNFSGREVNLEIGATMTRANQLCSMCAGRKADILFFKGLPVSWPVLHFVESLGPIFVVGTTDPLELQTVRTSS